MPDVTGEKYSDTRPPIMENKDEFPVANTVQQLLNISTLNTNDEILSIEDTPPSQFNFGFIAASLQMTPSLWNKIKIDMVEKYEIKREVMWSRTDGPEFFPNDTLVRITHRVGIRDVEMKNMRTLVKAEVGASGFGFSAKVSSELEISQSLTSEFSLMDEKIVEQTYIANNYYAAWTKIYTYTLTRFLNNSPSEILAISKSISSTKYTDKFTII